MYSQELENLIEAALMDGQITDKERAILLRRAEAEGVDVDEFEMVLDARLVAHRKQTQSEERKASEERARKSGKYGDLRKCPACGAMVEGFQLRCTECGYEFSNVRANQTSLSLQKMLDEVDQQQKPNRQGGVSGLFDTIANQMTMGLNSSTSANRKVQIIQTFPIPNTREDLIEMLTLCMSNAEYSSNDVGDQRLIREAWRSKAKQACMKANILLRDDPDAMMLVAETQRILGKWSVGKKILIGAVAFYVILFLLLFLFGAFH